MKTCAALILFLCWPSMLLAQFTLTSGTITDPQGLPYSNGTITPTLVISGSPRFSSSGYPYSPPTQPTGLDAKGTFAIQLGDVNALVPAGGTWSFHICSAAGTVQPGSPITQGPVCFDLKGVVITGSIMDITSQIEAVPPPSLTSLGQSGGGLLPQSCGVNTQGIFCPVITATTMQATTVQASIVAPGNTNSCNPAPAISFSSPTQTGFSTGTSLGGFIIICVSDIASVAINSSGTISSISSGGHGWASSSDPTQLDTALWRISANVVGVGNSANGVKTNGSLQLANLAFPNPVATAGLPNIDFPNPGTGAAGSCALPNLHWPMTNFLTNIGIYAVYPGNFAFCQTLPTPNAYLAGGWQLTSRGIFGWTSSPVDASQAMQLGVSALSGNGYKVIQVGNGTQGDESGMVRSSNTQRLTTVLSIPNTPTTLFSWTNLQVAFNVSWALHCHLNYNPQIAGNTVAIYVNFQVLPTSAAFSSRIYSDLNGSSESGTLGGVTATGPTFVFQGAPVTAPGFYEATLDGVMELPVSTAGTFSVQLASLSATTTVLFSRDLSYCTLQ